jgi:signal transduction histidine kinase
MHSLINPADPPEVARDKLIAIAEALMKRVEEASDDQGAAYAQFQRAVLLEDQVRARTRDLEATLGLLHRSNARLGEAMAEAEAARANLASAIETVEDGFALFDGEDRLVMTNARFGRPLADVRAQLRPGMGFGDYVDLVSRSEDLVRAAGETPQDWARGRMARHQDRAVTFIVALTGDRWLQVSEHRTREGGTVILQTDLTSVIRAERLQGAKLLDDQAQRVKATLDHLTQGVGVFDAEGRLVSFNRRLAEVLSLPLGRLLIGLALSDLMTMAGVQAEAGLAWAARRVAGVEFELERANGRIILVQGQDMPDRGFVVSFSDVTAERVAQRALAEANESLERRVAARTEELAAALVQASEANAARARFVAAASHDLLQPLSAAKLFLAALADEALPWRAGETLVKARNALGSVEEILSALLDISKLEAGRGAVEVGAVALGPLLARLREEFAPLAARKGLEFKVLGSRAVVASDPTYLRRILQNLIGNAIRYTETGKVLVGVRRAGAALRVEVIDTGPGIPEAERQAIFREFHRLGARASASEGMGLGLAIVERACLLLGHELGLDTALGRGSRFSVRLPLGASEARAAVAPEGAAGGLGGLIVLLVENDADLRRALVLVIEGWGAEVIEAASGEEALALLDEIGILPDRALVDYRLGAGMDGVALAGRLAAMGMAVRVITAERSGVEGVEVLRKPIAPEDLARFLAGA